MKKMPTESKLWFGALAATVILALGCMIGCDAKPDSATSLGTFGDMKTVTHDGHKFVIADYNGRIGGPIHHPDCCKPK